MQQPAPPAPPAAPSAPAWVRLSLGEGTFAFASAEGSELIALDSLTSPVQVRWAVCAGATVHSVAYARKQPRQPAGNGRQTRSNFANEAGDVFRVTGGAAQDDGTCYLTADSGLAFSASRSGGAGRACDPDWLRLASQAKGRNALHCWPLASVSPDVQVVAVEFAVVDTSALASLVLAVPGRLVFQDFPAAYKSAGQDVWRVDDEGHLSPTAFTVLFVGRLRGTWFMGVTWAGGEGEDDYLLVADSADAFRTAKLTYRYWAPN